MQPRVALARLTGRAGQQVDALLLGHPADVQNVDLTCQQARLVHRRVEAFEVDAAVPAANLSAVDAYLLQQRLAGGVVSLDGVMIEEAVRKSGQQVLARASSRG